MTSTFFIRNVVSLLESNHKNKYGKCILKNLFGKCKSLTKLCRMYQEKIIFLLLFKMKNINYRKRDLKVFVETRTYANIVVIHLIFFVDVVCKHNTTESVKKILQVLLPLLFLCVRLCFRVRLIARISI